jgi:hypothetical protein
LAYQARRLASSTMPCLRGVLAEQAVVEHQDADEGREPELRALTTTSRYDCSSSSLRCAALRLNCWISLPSLSWNPVEIVEPPFPVGDLALGRAIWLAGAQPLESFPIHFVNSG